jgi:aldehyde dehydrogenase (NAD+)
VRDSSRAISVRQSLASANHFPAVDEDEAVQIANDIAYGLGAGVWTQSVKRAHVVAQRIKAGTVWVNTYRAVSFLMPFGGYKASGLGRENGAEAIDGYLQSKRRVDQQRSR